MNPPSRSRRSAEKSPIALERAVEEDEIDGEVLIADLDRILGADEAEVSTELRDEATEVAQQRTVQIRLRVVIR